MYQVLARKYRPRNFIELVGQNHVSRALTSALERGRLHHAYLFTGTRGVGKTTIARILAKCLNCETGVTSTPCEVCPTCTAVNEGRFIDLIEIDAASRTKVEDTRELLDNVPYAPTQGRFKVYLIDEVHMLSTHSFNALLKTLEEPPEHVKFLFATTDPQKLPITVISRCLQFTLRPLAVDEITSHLTDILKKENITAEQDAIWQIAESAQGSLRDALSLTDQAIAYGQGSIQHQDVKEMLGLIDRTIIFDLILAIHQNQQQHVSALLMQFRQQALDVSLVLDQFISTLHELALLQYLPELSLKYSAEINAKIMQLSKLISAQDLQLYYQVACKGRSELQLAVTQEQGFEMCVLRLLAFRPLQPNEIQISKNVDVQVQPNVQQALESKPNESVETQDHANSTPVGFTENQSENNQQLDSTHSSYDDEAYYDDGFDMSESNDSQLSNLQQTNDEPSSDDFLDEEIEVSQQNAIPEPALSQVAIASEAVNSQRTSIQEPELSTFGEPSFEETAVQEFSLEANSADQDVFFLDPHAGEQTEESLELKSPVAPPSSFVQTVDVEMVQSNVDESASQLMPQDILSLQEQQLEGQWDVDKWEYWFRNSDLSPAVQELAQQGVMTGTINGESTFIIPEIYENILAQFRDALEERLRAQWSQTRFNVSYQEVSEQTAFTKQAERKERAYARAAELLNNEETVKDLIQTFDGDLHNIQLK